MPRKASIPAIALALLFAAGCAKAPPRAALATEGSRTAKAIALEERIARHRQVTASIRALAWLDLTDSGESRQTEAAVVIARPDRIRVDAMDALADVWAKAGSDGRTMWLFLPARDKLYSGRASTANLHRLAKFDWTLKELVDVLAGSPPIAAGQELLQAGRDRDGHFIAGVGLHLWIDPKSGRLVRCERDDASGDRPDYVVTYGDWRREGVTEFPCRIEAEFPGRGTKIVMLYREVALGSPPDASVFLPPKGGSKTVDLK